MGDGRWESVKIVGGLQILASVAKGANGEWCVVHTMSHEDGRGWAAVV